MDITSTLLQNGLRVFQTLRCEANGLYYDKFVFNGGCRVLSTSATGFGLMTLAIGCEAGFFPLEEALEEAQKTLQHIMGTGCFRPTRSSNGFFAHWLDHESGHSSGEISTIDTAIMVLGALFAKHYFQDPALTEIVDRLATSVRWEDAILQAHSHPAMYLHMGCNGIGVAGAHTRPFNEYYLLAFCGAFVEAELLAHPGPMFRFFEQHYDAPPQGECTRVTYCGIELLTDQGQRFLPSFIVQFCFYLSAYFAKNEGYQLFTTAAVQADVLFWMNATRGLKAQSLSQRQVWGCGAGAYPSNMHGDLNNMYGYKATAIEENDALVYSAPIVAGFLPVCLDMGKLCSEEWFVKRDACFYDLPDGNRVLWRASLKYPAWRSPTIEAVDFATSVFGCAAVVLGQSFFQKYAADLSTFFGDSLHNSLTMRSFSEADYRAVAAEEDNDAMAEFITKVANADGYVILERQGLLSFSQYYSGILADQSLARMRQELPCKGAEGWIASLTELSYQNLAHMKDNKKMAVFISEFAKSERYAIVDSVGLEKFAEYYSGIIAVQSLERMKQEFLEKVAEGWIASCIEESHL